MHTSDTHPPDTSIAVGDAVISFDFPEFDRDLVGANACYIEGTVEAILHYGESMMLDVGGAVPVRVGFPDCDRYVIRVSRAVRGGAESDRFGRYVFPPVNGTPGSLGGLCNGVVRRS